MFIAAGLLAALGSSKHIVVLSIGDRPWCVFYRVILPVPLTAHTRSLLSYFCCRFTPLVHPSIQAYASKVGATMEVITNVSSVAVPADISNAWSRKAIGRSNNTVYVLKLLAAGTALQKHAQVLMIDDTTYIKPEAADVFEACSGAGMCAYSEGLAEDVEPSQMTWKASSQWLAAKGVNVHREDYINTGVVVFGSQALNSWLSKEKIAESLELGMWAGAAVGAGGACGSQELAQRRVGQITGSDCCRVRGRGGVIYRLADWFGGEWGEARGSYIPPSAKVWERCSSARPCLVPSPPPPCCHLCYVCISFSVQTSGECMATSYLPTTHSLLKTSGQIKSTWLLTTCLLPIHYSRLLARSRVHGYLPLAYYLLTTQGFWPDQEYMAWVGTTREAVKDTESEVVLLDEGWNCMLVRGESHLWCATCTPSPTHPRPAHIPHHTTCAHNALSVLNIF